MNSIAYIDNQPFTILPKETILQFIRRNITTDEIPTLCEAPNISPGGSCRICSVEVSRHQKTERRIVASCHTMIHEQDHVFTNSKKIRRLRKNIVELILTDHPLECTTCEADGQCRLQSVAFHLGVSEVRYPQGKNHNSTPKDLSHSYIISDLSKCINCNLCVRACDEVQGEFILSMHGRGFDSRIIKGLDTTFQNSDCVSCGACVQACPTVAISDIYASKSKQRDKKVRTICTYCGVGCNLDVSVKDNDILYISAPYDAETNNGHACLKGRYAFKFYNHPDRLRQPLIRKSGKLEPASWEEAYDLIASKLISIKSKFGPSAIAGISSARCTNEENYLMQKFFRTVIGTNNIDGCARICHAPTATGMQRAFGTGAATNSIADIQSTDCMLVIGANPSNAHPVTGAKIKQAALSGKTLIVIDPRKTDLARFADYHLALRPGTNVALLNMMIRSIIDEDLVNHEFIASRCEGYDQLKEKIMQLDMDHLSEICGVDKSLVSEASRAYASAQNAMCFHGLGVTEHMQGTFGVMLIANLAMITGNIGRPGTGVNPLRGQNNVQGAADMGVQPNQGPGYLNMSDPAKRHILENAYGVGMPTDAGLTIPRMFEAALEGNLKSIWIMGEDVMQTEPNTSKIEMALQNLEFIVVQELFMSKTAEYAHVILPASSFFEKNGTFTNGERRIQKVQEVVPPLSGTKPDGQIMVEIMNIMGCPQPMYHPEWVLEEIAGIVPFFKGVKWKDLGHNGKQWPVHENGQDTKILHKDDFSHGPGKFHYIDFEESRELLMNAAEFPFILTTNRSLEHYNSGSMTRRTKDSKIMAEDLLLINPQDAIKCNLENEDIVHISSKRGSTQIKIKISDEVKPGILSTTFHFPSILINQITSDVLDSEADCPEYKVVAVNITKV